MGARNNNGRSATRRHCSSRSSSFLSFFFWLRLILVVITLYCAVHNIYRSTTTTATTTATREANSDLSSSSSLSALLALPPSFSKTKNSSVLLKEESIARVVNNSNASNATNGSISHDNNRTRLVSKDKHTNDHKHNNTVRSAASSLFQESSNNSTSITTTTTTTTTHTSNTTTTKSPHNYAYVFLMGGCDNEKGSHRGMLFNILIATYTLQTSGSTADFVLFVQMSSSTTTKQQQQLVQEEIDWLQALQIRVIYLPTPRVDNFHQINMNKLFATLSLVEYKRVLYLDSDIMPFCNLDYIFQLSHNNNNGKNCILSGDDHRCNNTNNIIKENMILAWGGSPSNGGFFLLTPHKGDVERLQQIIVEQQVRAKQILPQNQTLQFDETEGWGHVINGGNDRYVYFEGYHKRRTGKKWNFFAAYSDQGLLYYWVKYIQKDVTIVTGKNVYNWGLGTNHTLQIEETLLNPFDSYSCLNELQKKQEESHWDTTTKTYTNNNAYSIHIQDTLNRTPYRDFVHFQFSTKPWESKVMEPPIQFKQNAKSTKQYWFHMLHVINTKLDMKLRLPEDWNKIQKNITKPPLGRLPKVKHFQATTTNEMMILLLQKIYIYIQAHNIILLQTQKYIGCSVTTRREKHFFKQLLLLLYNKQTTRQETGFF